MSPDTVTMRLNASSEVSWHEAAWTPYRKPPRLRGVHAYTQDQRRRSPLPTPKRAEVPESFAPALVLPPQPITVPYVRAGVVMAPNQPQVSYVTLVATPSAPFWARRHIEGILDKWDVKDFLGATELVVTEFLTNGIKASGVEIDVGWGEHVLPEEQLISQVTRCREADGSVQPPESAFQYPEREPVPVLHMRIMVNHLHNKLLVEAWDQNPEPPVMQTLSDDAEGGRGLVLVSVICKRWGYYWPSAPVRSGHPWPLGLSHAPQESQETYGKVVWGEIFKD